MASHVLGLAVLRLASFVLPPLLKVGCWISTLELLPPHRRSLCLRIHFPRTLEFSNHAFLNHPRPDMSGTCIVCLGDLGDGPDALAGLSPKSAKSPPPASEGDQVTTTFNLEATEVHANETEKIAHLKPCGHNLHNDCLKPWVERANSCPICRAKFYTVELSNKVGGETYHSSLTPMMHNHINRRRHNYLYIQSRRSLPSGRPRSRDVFGRGG